MRLGSLRYTQAFALLLLAGCAHVTPARPAPLSPTIPRGKDGTVIVAAGDIACDPKSRDFNQGRGTAENCHMLATSDLAISLKPAAVFVLGESQYERGTADAYQQSWALNWGRKELRDITHPSPGNHEYHTKDARGYFDFFGAQAGERSKGYYSFILGTWHIVALNTGGNDKCRPVSCEQGSEQEKWLREDLGKSTSSCILAFWHRPLVTSGHHRNATEVRPFWRDLYQANADVILNAHSHHYERFAPQNPDGVADPERGITQFIVGTGGRNLKKFWRKQANSVIRNGKSFGVLELELLEKSYAWKFISEYGQVLDSGSGQCHQKSRWAILKKGLYEQPSTSNLQGAVSPFGKRVHADFWAGVRGAGNAHGGNRAAARQKIGTSQA